MSIQTARTDRAAAGRHSVAVMRITDGTRGLATTRQSDQQAAEKPFSLSDGGCQARRGDLRDKAHLEPPLTSWPPGRPPERGTTTPREGRTAPTLFMARLCPSIRTFANEGIPSGHSGERAIAPRHSVRPSGPTCEPNHYADLPSRSPRLASSQATSVEA